MPPPSPYSVPSPAQLSWIRLCRMSGAPSSTKIPPPPNWLAKFSVQLPKMLLCSINGLPRAT